MAAVFEAIDTLKEVRQSEVISNLNEYSYNPETEQLTSIAHEYVVVASQDCDLLRDFELRVAARGVSVHNGILVFAARSSAVLTEVAGDIRKRIRQNKEERYHCIEECPLELDAQDIGVPALVIDFRVHFTLSSASLYWQINNGALRRSMLSNPYREHFQSRVAFYLSRVSLPAPHVIPPPG